MLSTLVSMSVIFADCIWLQGTNIKCDKALLPLRQGHLSQAGGADKKLGQEHCNQSAGKPRVGTEIRR